MKFIDAILAKLGIKKRKQPAWRDAWLKLHTDERARPSHRVELAVVRAVKRAKRQPDLTAAVLADLQRAFTPVTNCAKLESQAYDQYGSLKRAIAGAALHCRFGHALNVDLPEIMDAEEADLYARTMKSLSDTPFKKIKAKLRARYVYTFVRRDLTPEQRLVQTGHALYEAGHELALRDGDAKPWQTGVVDTHLVCVDVPDLDALKGVRNVLWPAGSLHPRVDFTPYFEEAMDGEMTSIATEPVRLTGKEMFRNYSKLTLPRDPEQRKVWTVEVPEGMEVSKEDVEKISADFVGDGNQPASYHSGEHDYGL